MDGRSTEEVFEDHLRHRNDRDLEADLHNYAHDVVILSTYGEFHGHDGVRDSGRLLHEHVPNGTYRYQKRMTSGEMAFLVWTAEGGTAQVCDGADSFLIRDGLIRVQTIHYRVVDAAQEPD